jgi:hypothetical protein
MKRKTFGREKANGLERSRTFAAPVEDPSTGFAGGCVR